MYRIYEKHLEHKKLVCQIGSSSVDGTMIQEIGHKLVDLMTYVCKLNTHKKKMELMKGEQCPVKKSITQMCC